MNTKIERFITFIEEEKTRNFFAFVFYITSIGIFMDVPLELRKICYIAQIFILLLGFPIYLSKWCEKVIENNKGKLIKNAIKKMKEIAEEIALEIVFYIPFMFIFAIINSFIIVGQSANQTSIETSFYEAPIFNFIIIIIIGPIIEEIIFRYMPYRFIKNKIVYIVVSSVIFAAMHVINDSNPFYYIWPYMLESVYFGYCYHRTKNLLVPISIHSFSNLVAMLLFLCS